MLKIRGKGIVDADPTTNNKNFTVRVKVPASLRLKGDDGKYTTVPGTWFLQGWQGNINPYTGRAVDSILQYLKQGTQVDFEGTVVQIKKDDGTYSTVINLVALDFASLPTKNKDGANKPAYKQQAAPAPVKEEENFSEVPLDDMLGMETIDLGMELG